MKDFLKYTFATVVGIVLAGVIFTIVSIIAFSGLVASMSSMQSAAVSIQKNSVLELNLQGTLQERSANDPFSQLMGNSDYEAYGLDDMLKAIQNAKENDKIKGIYIQAGVFAAAPSSYQEIRNALLDFKKSGKFIVAYGDTYTQGSYYLSSVADHIFLNPQGEIAWYGLSSQPVFYKDLLSKIGVEMQVFKVGTYKSAVEPFIATEMSPANREQVTSFLGSIWNEMLTGVSASRKITKESLNACADTMIMFRPATDCVKFKLVDELAYKDGVKSYLKKKVGVKEDESLNLVDIEDMAGVESNKPKDKSGNIIAVYYAYGEIDNGSSITSSEGINSEKVIRDLRSLNEDKDVKAVVFRVNSPGGSAYGSEQICHEVEALAKKKPVIVSMGDYAASGGYYISSAATYILAEPTTLTGSIGIFGMFPNAKGLLTDKLGLHFDVVKTNKYADFCSVSRGMNEGEKALLQAYINRGYDTFISRCSKGRKISKDSINAIGQGRVWTGSQAKKLGLVDELGGINKAITIASQRAKIKDYTLCEYPSKENVLMSLLDKVQGNYMSDQMKANFGEYYDYFKGVSFLTNLKRVDRIQARIPFELNLNLND